MATPTPIPAPAKKRQTLKSKAETLETKKAAETKETKETKAQQPQIPALQITHQPKPIVISPESKLYNRLQNLIKDDPREIAHLHFYAGLLILRPDRIDYLVEYEIPETIQLKNPMLAEILVLLKDSGLYGNFAQLINAYFSSEDDPTQFDAFIEGLPKEVLKSCGKMLLIACLFAPAFEEKRSDYFTRVLKALKEIIPEDELLEDHEVFDVINQANKTHQKINASQFMLLINNGFTMRMEDEFGGGWLHQILETLIKKGEMQHYELLEASLNRSSVNPLIKHRHKSLLYLVMDRIQSEYSQKYPNEDLVDILIKTAALLIFYGIGLQDNRTNHDTFSFNLFSLKREILGRLFEILELDRKDCSLEDFEKIFTKTFYPDKSQTQLSFFVIAKELTGKKVLVQTTQALDDVLKKNKSDLEIINLSQIARFAYQSNRSETNLEVLKTLLRNCPNECTGPRDTERYAAYYKQFTHNLKKYPEYLKLSKEVMETLKLSLEDTLKNVPVWCRDPYYYSRVLIALAEANLQEFFFMFLKSLIERLGKKIALNDEVINKCFNFLLQYSIENFYMELFERVLSVKFFRVDGIRTYFRALEPSQEYNNITLIQRFRTQLLQFRKDSKRTLEPFLGVSSLAELTLSYAFELNHDEDKCQHFYRRLAEATLTPFNYQMRAGSIAPFDLTKDYPCYNPDEIPGTAILRQLFLNHDWYIFNFTTILSRLAEKGAEREFCFLFKNLSDFFGEKYLFAYLSENEEETLKTYSTLFCVAAIYTENEPLLSYMLPLCNIKAFLQDQRVSIESIVQFIEDEQFKKRSKPILFHMKLFDEFNTHDCDLISDYLGSDAFQAPKNTGVLSLTQAIDPASPHFAPQFEARMIARQAVVRVSDCKQPQWMGLKSGYF